MQGKVRTASVPGTRFRLKPGPEAQEDHLDLAQGKDSGPSVAHVWQDVALEDHGEKRKPGRLERLMRLFAPVI